MKAYCVVCTAFRLDGVHATWREIIVTDSKAAALLAVEHYRTTPPAPVDFSAWVASEFEMGDPLIPPMDPGHPLFWNASSTWDANTHRLAKIAMGDALYAWRIERDRSMGFEP